MTQHLDEARARLAARQRDVLGALLAGQVPDGFDQATTRLAARQLAGKRRDEALRACPRLAELPGWPEAFARHALAGPRTGCAHDDVARFLASLAGEPSARDWLAEQAVLDGARRFAWIRRRGRRELLVGIGEQMWRLAMRQERRKNDES
ncbi:MAG: hypothetical protein ACRC20_11305 [Segniliparus sp.]|uniref:hypothetical protein n=1 Tax=Segniliparus sp. TaxID=2804064 RepID=UPI003F2C2512